MDNLVKDMGTDSPVDDKKLEEHMKGKHEKFMNKVIEENLNMSGEIRGVQVNGKEVRGIES